MTITPIDRIILPPTDGRADWLPVITGPGISPPPGKDPYATYISRPKSEHTKRAMKSRLDNIARMIARDAVGAGPDPGENPGAIFPWWLLRYQHTARIAALLGSQTPPYTPSTINNHLAALRGVLKQCWKLELMTGDDYSRAKDIEDIKFEREQAGRLIHDDEMTKMLGTCTDGIVGIRDAALLAVLRCTGIRGEEASTALIERYDGRERSLRVLGKGNKERTVYLHSAGAAYLERWLALLGDQRGPMFRAVDKHHQIGTAMSAGAIRRRVELRQEQARLRKLTAHDFRKTFLSELLDVTGDSMKARRLAGHSSVATTQLYDLRENRGLRDAVDRMHIAIPAPPAE